MPDKKANDPPLQSISSDSSRIVKSAETLFSIIELLNGENGLGVSEIASQVDVSKSAVHKHLTTLKKHGFVTNSGGKYRIGLRFLEIGLREQKNRSIYHIAKPKIDKVTQETGHLVWCVIEENGLGVFLYGSEGDHAVKTDALPGLRMHMHYLSGGKAMLAHMSEKEVRDIIERYGLPKKTEHTIVDEQVLLSELEQIRERGVALDFQESIYGLHSVSAPVLTQSGDPLAAVVIAGAAKRMGREACRNEVADIALAAANEIELDLQYAWNAH